MTLNSNTIIGKFLGSCNKKDREKMLKVLSDFTIPSTKISQVLTDNGCPAAPRTVRDFRHNYLG